MLVFDFTLMGPTLCKRELLPLLGKNSNTIVTYSPHDTALGGPYMFKQLGGNSKLFHAVQRLCRMQMLVCTNQVSPEQAQLLPGAQGGCAATEAIASKWTVTRPSAANVSQLFLEQPHVPTSHRSVPTNHPKVWECERQPRSFHA